MHEADHVGGTELRFHEAGKLLPRRHARPLLHVIVVQEDGKQAHVVARRLALLVEIGPDLAHRTAAGRQAAVERDELERLDPLWLAFLGDLEVFRLEVADGVAVLVGQDDVHTNEVDAGAESRWLSCRRGLGLSLVRILTGRRGTGGLLRGRTRLEQQQHDRDGAKAKEPGHPSILDLSPDNITAGCGDDGHCTPAPQRALGR